MFANLGAVMDHDLKNALNLLESELDMSQIAAEEYLSLLERVDVAPRTSVLFPENCEKSFEINVLGAKRAWVLMKRAYTCTFALIVAETRRGHRVIIQAVHLTGDD